MLSSSSRPPLGQDRSRLPAVAHDVVPAAITFAALGLDISQAEVTACLLLADGSEVVPRWTLPNSLSGAQTLTERIQVLIIGAGDQRAPHWAGSDWPLLVASSLLSEPNRLCSRRSIRRSTCSIPPGCKG